MKRPLDILLSLCEAFIMPPDVIIYFVENFFMRRVHLIITRTGNILHLFKHPLVDQLLVRNDTRWGKKQSIVSFFNNAVRISSQTSTLHFLILRICDWPFCSWQCPYFMSHYSMLCSGHLGSEWGEPCL